MAFDCDQLANELLNDEGAPDWFKRSAQWYKEGMIPCEGLAEGAVYLANTNVISGELQQDIQLTQLGVETTRRSEELQEQIRAQAEKDQAQDDYIDEINTRLSNTVVNLGESVTDASKATGDNGISSFLAGGALGGGAVLLLILVFMLKK